MLRVKGVRDATVVITWRATLQHVLPRKELGEDLSRAFGRQVDTEGPEEWASGNAQRRELKRAACSDHAPGHTSHAFLEPLDFGFTKLLLGWNR